MARPRFRLIRRVWWSAVLILVACGGAGLAVATEKPQDQPRTSGSAAPGTTNFRRPELFGQADQELQPWVSAIDTRLAALDGPVAVLSSAGADLLGALFNLDPVAAVAAAGAGDAASAATVAAVEEAFVVRDGALAAVEAWRLSPVNRQRLASFDAALDSSRGLADSWAAVSADARLAAGVLQPLAAHDELLTEATNAGRDARWRAALDALDAAAEPLDEASAAVGRLPASFDVARLEILVSAYRQYDASLRALYAHIRRTRSQEGPDVADLLRRVEELQPDVPMDRFALGEVVVGALGQPATDAITATENARADIFDALPGEELDGSVEELELDAVE